MFAPKKVATLLALVALLLVGACSEEDHPTGPADDGTAGVTALDRFRALQKAAPGYRYEVALDGMIDLATGGTVKGTPASWPIGPDAFAYTINPDAVVRSSLPDPTAQQVHITVWVPVFDTVFPDPDTPMPMILEPDGLVYEAQREASVQLAYHPKLAAPTEERDPVAVYCIDGDAPGLVSLGELLPPQDPDQDPAWPASTRVRASIPHHSRWAMDKTDGTGGD